MPNTLVNAPPTSKIGDNPVIIIIFMIQKYLSMQVQINQFLYFEAVDRYLIVPLSPIINLFYVTDNLHSYFPND